MISRYSIPVKKSYSFFRVETEEYEPLYCGYTLQYNEARAYQYKIEYNQSQAKWGSEDELIFRVEYNGILDPVFITEFEAKNFIVKEIEELGGIELLGGKLRNSFIPIVKELPKNRTYSRIENKKYPLELMRFIAHSFSLPIDTSLREMKKRIAYINKKLIFPRFKENEIVLRAPQLIVQYELYNFDIKDFEEPRILLEADNGKSFTAIELLYKLHQKLGPILGNQDNRFFEGFTFATDQEPENMGVPIYFLDTGL